MNRAMTDLFSAGLPAERQGELAHRYILGLYSVLARLRRALSGRQLTEKEQVRQEYRRAIRKFRKTAPERSATPSEIERGTAFPEGFDAAGLHERYEQARYGR